MQNGKQLPVYQGPNSVCIEGKEIGNWHLLKQMGSPEYKDYKTINFN